MEQPRVRKRKGPAPRPVLNMRDLVSIYRACGSLKYTARFAKMGDNGPPISHETLRRRLNRIGVKTDGIPVIARQKGMRSLGTTSGQRKIVLVRNLIDDKIPAEISSNRSDQKGNEGEGE